MLEFLKGLHQEEVNGLSVIDLDKSGEDVKVKVAVTKTRLNIYSLLYNLPTNVKTLKDQFDQHNATKLKLVQAQEGGSI